MKYKVEIYADEGPVCTVVTGEHTDVGDAQDDLQSRIADEIVRYGKKYISWLGFAWVSTDEGWMPIPSSFAKSMIGKSIEKYRERIKKGLSNETNEHSVN